MANKDELGCSGSLIFFIFLYFLVNPTHAIIIVLVGISIYKFVEINYKRIKREEKLAELNYKTIKREERERREKELERKEMERFEAGFRENMSGDEYENYCKYILKLRGWIVELTPKSGDQGVDLIATKEYLKVCIQCKRYSKPVGNKAVQEIFTGKQFYSGSHGVLVSNAGFTKSAKSLASKTGIILLSDENLMNLESFLKKNFNL